MTKHRKVKINKTQWYIKLPCHECDNEEYIKMMNGYYEESKDRSCKSIQKAFELRELFNGENIKLKLIESVRYTRNLTYNTFEVVQKSSFPIKCVDINTEEWLDINTHLRVAVYDYKETNLRLEILSEDLLYMLRYYDSKTKVFTLPYKNFYISNNTENPSIKLYNKKL
jgi:hypothetical protein